MKFFILVCTFGLLVGLLSLSGCATSNWSKPRWMAPGTDPAISDSPDASQPTNWSTDRTGGGKATGWDNRAREIEKNLGYE